MKLSFIDPGWLRTELRLMAVVAVADGMGGRTEDWVEVASLSRVDEQLDSFVGEVFSHLGRKDRRATAGLYLRGLMLDGRRKSMQPMAARLGEWITNDSSSS